jgi:hypothetical protein
MQEIGSRQYTAYINIYRRLDKYYVQPDDKTVMFKENSGHIPHLTQPNLKT